MQLLFDFRSLTESPRAFSVPDLTKAIRTANAGDVDFQDANHGRLFIIAGSSECLHHQSGTLACTSSLLDRHIDCIGGGQHRKFRCNIPDYHDSGGAGGAGSTENTWTLGLIVNVGERHDAYYD